MTGFFVGSTTKRGLYLRVIIASWCAISFLFLSRTAHGITLGIYGPPLRQAVLASSNATFVVSAGPSPLTYQWRFNGNDLSPATSSTFTITNVQPANTGNYTVVLSNSSGAITSSAASLSIVTPPDYLWARQVTNGVAPNYSAISGARHVAADGAGNVFVAGTFSGGSPSIIDF